MQCSRARYSWPDLALVSAGHDNPQDSRQIPEDLWSKTSTSDYVS